MQTFHKLILGLMLILSATGANASSILVLGDSLSAAYGIDEQEGWVHLLKQRLEQTGHEGKVINASISGETTAGGLARLPRLLDEFAPDVLILELGGNDGLRGYPVTVMQKNLQQMIQLGQQQGAEVVLLGMQIPPNYGARYTQMFQQSYTRLAESHDTQLVPFFLEGVATDGRLMQADGIHPTAQAQPALLENVWPELEAVLQQLQVSD